MRVIKQKWEHFPEQVGHSLVVRLRAQFAPNLKGKRRYGEQLTDMPERDGQPSKFLKERSAVDSGGNGSAVASSDHRVVRGRLRQSRVRALKLIEESRSCRLDLTHRCAPRLT